MRYPVDVYTGKIQAYPEGKPSAIAKIQVDGELMLTELGLEGDEQAEKKVHGGPDRALCHYPREHYLYWAREFPEQAELFVAPAFGENLSTDGLTESNVYIGDIFRWGEAFIQVSQPRSPCYKLNYHFDISDIAQLMQNTGKVGWLYSVIAPGLVSADAPLELVSRVSDVTVQEAAAIAWHMPFDDEQYHRLLSAAGLSKSRTRTMQKRRLSRPDKTLSASHQAFCSNAGCGVNALSGLQMRSLTPLIQRQPNHQPQTAQRAVFCLHPTTVLLDSCFDNRQP